ERQVAEDVAHPRAQPLAQVRHDLVRRVAVLAGVAAVLDQRDLGIGAAQHVVASWIDRNGKAVGACLGHHGSVGGTAPRWGGPTRAGPPPPTIRPAFISLSPRPASGTRDASRRTTARTGRSTPRAAPRPSRAPVPRARVAARCPVRGEPLARRCAGT